MDTSVRLLLVASLMLVAACRSEVPMRSIKDGPAKAPAEADKLQAWCGERYSEYLSGNGPKSLEDKLKGDAICRPVICPSCPS